MSEGSDVVVGKGVVSTGLSIGGDAGNSSKMRILDGGKAVSTGVYSIGEVVVSAGGLAEKTTINNGGYVLVETGGSATETTMNGERAYLDVYGSISKMVVKGGADMYLRGGSCLAEDVLIESGVVNLSGGTLIGGTIACGYLNISSGATAQNVAGKSANSEINISAGGLLIAPELTDEALMSIKNGGTVSDGSVAAGCVIYVNVNTTVQNVQAAAGSLVNGIALQNGMTLNLTPDDGLTIAGGTVTEKRWASLHDGQSASQIVISGASFFSSGTLEVEKGAEISGVLIGKYGKLNVSAGGIAENLEIEADGRVLVSAGADVSDVQVYAGGNIQFGGGAGAAGVTVLDGGRINGFTIVSGMTFSGNTIALRDVTLTGGTEQSGALFSGQSAVGVNIGNYASATVYSGGRIANCSVGEHGYLNILGNGRGGQIEVLTGGSFRCASNTIFEDTLFASAGSIVNNFTLTEDNDFSQLAGGVFCLSGAVVQSGVTAAVWSGMVVENLEIKGASDKTTAVNVAGGTITGEVTIDQNSLMKMGGGSLIDFNIGGRSHESAALLNDLSLVAWAIGAGAPVYSLTLDIFDLDGTWALAGNAAADMLDTITVRTSGGNTLGSLAGSTPLKVGSTTYTLTIDGGKVLKVTQSTENKYSGNNITAGKTLTVAAGESASSITVSGGTLTADNVGKVHSLTLKSGSGKFNADSLLDNAVISGGKLTLAAGAAVSGSMVISKPGSLTVKGSLRTKDFTLCLDLSGSNPGCSFFVDDLTLFDGVSTAELTLGQTQAFGSYNLVVSGLETVLIGQTSVSIGDCVRVGDFFHSLTNAGNGIVYTYQDLIGHFDLTGSASGLGWNMAATSGTGTATVTFSRSSSFDKSFVWKDCPGLGVSFYGLSDGNAYWRLTNTEETMDGADFTVKKSSQPQKYQAVTDGKVDIFFVTPSGVFDEGYAAFYPDGTSLGDWLTTTKLVETKNNFYDSYFGAGDRNAMYLTDDNCGDALFFDDAYSPGVSGAANGRLGALNEVFAGAGDDVIDFSSSRLTYEYAGTLHGGDGNDIIWVCSGANYLFGDAGNDEIIGGTGADVIAGGSGDDRMYGGGAPASKADIFTFGDFQWGNDQIGQTADSDLVLWFAEGIDAADLNFNFDGTNSTITCSLGVITVHDRDVTSADCRFGSTGYEEEYSALDAKKAFAAASSEKTYS